MDFGRGAMGVPRAVDAIFENGVFRPLEAVRLPEHQRVALLVTPHDDPIADTIAWAASLGRSFAFLEAEAEDIYSPADGEPI
jgi:predicted DNA-binding antitoxin AbrB/MazE fold protein